MAVLRIILHAAIGLTLAIAILVLNLLFLAKPLYALYADLFQSGQMYQGETRALMYNRFLLVVIAPFSLLLGGVLAWILVKLRRLAFVLAVLVIIVVLLIAAFLHLRPVLATPAPLHDHPNAQWSGGVDGGTFFEITEADLPRYFLEIRYENGSLWAKGWVDGQEQRLTSSDFLGYYGGKTVELKSGKQLRLIRDR